MQRFQFWNNRDKRTERQRELDTYRRTLDILETTWRESLPIMRENQAKLEKSAKNDTPLGDYHKRYLRYHFWILGDTPTTLINSARKQIDDFEKKPDPVTLDELAILKKHIFVRAISPITCSIESASLERIDVGMGELSAIQMRAAT